eukprot:1156561-Pelagomonas_calceolata.AAC.2
MSVRNGGRRRGNREHLAPATATAPAFKVLQPSQLLPEQRYNSLMEVKHCEDTRPKNQLEAFKQQHRGLCCLLSRASAQVTLHNKLHQACSEPHSVQYANRLVSSPRHALKKTSCQQDQGLLLVISLDSSSSLGGGDTWCFGPRYPLFLHGCGEPLHCLHSFSFFSSRTWIKRRSLGQETVHTRSMIRWAWASSLNMGSCNMWTAWKINVLERTALRLGGIPHIELQHGGKRRWLNSAGKVGGADQSKDLGEADPRFSHYNS